jgi:hypothetical protein
MQLFFPWIEKWGEDRRTCRIEENFLRKRKGKDHTPLLLYFEKLQGRLDVMEVREKEKAEGGRLYTRLPRRSKTCLCILQV